MNQYDGFSDEELLFQYSNGEKGISDYLIEKYKNVVRKRAREMYLLGGERDDLIQEGMIGLFKAIRDYQPEKQASFQTFARLCIDRQLYSAVQNSNRQKHMPLNFYISLSQEEEEQEHEMVWAEDPETIVIGREEASDLETEITTILSSMENKVLGYYRKGLSYVQIAEEMGKSPKSIDNALQRIRSKIRQCLDNRKMQ